MKRVYIKYNPYKLETELTVDGNSLAENSRIGERIMPGSRLQEWIEEFPEMLIDEYNDNEFEIHFHGTMPDYEDIKEVFGQAQSDGRLSAVYVHTPAKETADKEALIDEVFKEIQKGPFDELRDEAIINAFEHAKSSDFEVCTVATMSAGKSTLINAMLGTKLMPSKQEACTAIITRIRDSKESDCWKAEVYNKEGRLVETCDNLTYEHMEELNGDENISVINTEGNIPFVSSDDVSLVLIDTPGPNNSRDPEHKRIQSDFLKKSSKSLVLYIMEGTFGSDDDNALLRRVAESMKVGDKQSKDRYIFVVNKMDDRRKEDGETYQTLERIRAYLEEHDIKNPNLFPAAALPALNIRLEKSGVELDDDTLDETEMKVRKLNRNENLHFEEYAVLPPSVQKEINEKLQYAKENDEREEEALIHTGVVSIEAAIRQYVEKYAKTAKIKNIVDTFIHKMEEVSCYEATKQELAKNTEDKEAIIQHIENINAKIEDINSAKEFKDAVDDAVVEVADDADEIVRDIVTKYQSRVHAEIEKLRGCRLDVDEAEQEIKRMEKFASRLEPEFQSDLDELIRGSLIRTGDVLLEEYRNRLASLTSEIDLESLQHITINPLEIMSGSFSGGSGIDINKMIKSRKVKVGEEWVANTNKKWYKPWTWFQEKGHIVEKFRTEKYVTADKLAQGFFAPIEEAVLNNGDAARKYAVRESNAIADYFYGEFQRLDSVLKEKLDELKSYAEDKEKAEERIRETEARLEWLDNIKNRVNSILEI